MQSYFFVVKSIRVNSTQYCIINIPIKQELQEIAFNHSSDIDFRKSLQKCTAKAYSFLAIDTTLPSDNSVRFRKNLLKKCKK